MALTKLHPNKSKLEQSRRAPHLRKGGGGGGLWKNSNLLAEVSRHTKAALYLLKFKQITLKLLSIGIWPNKTRPKTSAKEHLPVY